MLDIKQHDLILKQILRDIYKNSKLQGQLAFKGGTCLYLFYGLNRFSTDLDFNLTSEEFSFEELTEIMSQYINIDNFRNKKNTWFWLGSYKKGLQKIKIEVSKRSYPDEYVVNDFFGLLVKTLSPSYMFAHKLCAITDRRKLQNRDLFDSWFMFKKEWEPNEEILKMRTNMNKSEYYKYLIDFINKNVNKNYILDGLGEVLDEKLKIWVKQNLVDELLFQLQIRNK